MKPGVDPVSTAPGRNSGGLARLAGWAVGVRRWLLILVLFCGPMTSRAQSAEDPDTLFQEAARAYATGETRTAIDLYTRLLVRQYAAPELFCNLGLACLEAGQPERAILNLRRAWYLLPRDPAIRTAMSAALQTAHLPPERRSHIARCFTVLSHAEWAAVAIGAYWLFCLAIGLCLLARKHAGRWAVMAGVMAMTVLLAAAGIRHWTRHHEGQEAVVTAANSTARIAPAPGAKALMTVPPGALVNLLDTHGEWTKVRWCDRTGWLPTPAMEKVF